MSRRTGAGLVRECWNIVPPSENSATSTQRDRVVLRARYVHNVHATLLARGDPCVTHNCTSAAATSSSIKRDVHTAWTVRSIAELPHLTKAATIVRAAQHNARVPIRECQFLCLHRIIVTVHDAHRMARTQCINTARSRVSLVRATSFFTSELASTIAAPGVHSTVLGVNCCRMTTRRRNVLHLVEAESVNTFWC